MEKIDLKYLQTFSPFDTVATMDKSIYDYTEFLINKGVNQSAIDVLWTLGASSLRVVGISFKKQSTIAGETGYVRKTVNKAIKELETIGVIDCVHTRTKAGRPSVKVVRILPFSIDRLQQDDTAGESEEPNGGTELRLANEFQPIASEATQSPKEDNKTDVDNITLEDLDSSFVPRDVVVHEFLQEAKPFFSAQKIFKLWGVVNNVMKQVKLSLSNDSIAATINAFKASIFMYKANRIKTTFDKYFYGVLSEKLSVLKRQEVATAGKIPFSNWLEE